MATTSKIASRKIAGNKINDCEAICLAMAD